VEKERESERDRKRNRIISRSCDKLHDDDDVYDADDDDGGV
jgi:hypothetical protein